MVAHRHDPGSQNRLLLGAVRAAVLAQCHELLGQLDDVDAELAALAARRRRLTEALKQRRSLLVYRPSSLFRARQPAPDGSVRLPPLHTDATALWGRRLRATCVTILRRAGALSLPEVHVLLHHHGFRVASDHPVKALSDALAYEVERGRLLRPERGVYAPLGPPNPHHRGGLDAPLAPCNRLDHLSAVFAPHAA